MLAGGGLDDEAKADLCAKKFDRHGWAEIYGSVRGAGRCGVQPECMDSNGQGSVRWVFE